MPDPVMLTVPVDSRFRPLGSEAAGKYVELAGASSADVQTVVASVATALDGIASDSAPGAHVDLALRAESATVEVTMTSGSLTRVVTHPLSPARP